MKKMKTAKNTEVIFFKKRFESIANLLLDNEDEVPTVFEAHV